MMQHDSDCDCTCDFTEPKPNRVSEPGGERFTHKRWACDVLHEMREILKARSKRQLTPSDYTLATLVEELQSMVNRMEAALEIRKQIREWEEEARAIASKVDLMQKEAYEMGLELDSQKHNALVLNDTNEGDEINAGLHKHGM